MTDQLTDKLIVGKKDGWKDWLEEWTYEQTDTFVKSISLDFFGVEV